VLIASLILIAGALTPMSIKSSSVVFAEGGKLNSVFVPAMAFWRAARSWFCQIHQVRSICAWCRKK